MSTQSQEPEPAQTSLASILRARVPFARRAHARAWLALGALAALGACSREAPAAPAPSAAALRGEPLRTTRAESSEPAAAPAAASATAPAPARSGANDSALAAVAPWAASGEAAAVAAPVAAAPAIQPPSDSEAAKLEQKAEDESALAKSYAPLNFKQLSGFTYQQPTAKQLNEDPAKVVASLGDRVPAEILALQGKQVALEGFMSPIDFDKDGVKSFSLIHNAVGCCFGMFPRMNEWVYVEMAGGKKCDFFSVEPATIYGRLEIGEEIRDGYVVSLYRIRADHVYGTF